MPRKVFVAGEILTAADVNTNLADQAVMTFAGTAARGSAIGTAVEGMVTYLEDTDQLEVYGGTAVGWTSASNFLFGTATPTDGQVVSYSTAVSGYVPADAATAAGDNLLYNGAMQVAQRGTSETGITSTGYYTADRFRHTLENLGTWTSTIESDGPTGSGFTKSLKVECTTADAAPASGDLFNIAQNLEGQDVQGLKKGTADAESLTISFWVKSNVTGTYVVELLDADNTRQISQSYSVALSGTWEKKTLTFDGDTTGAFDNDNATSLQVNFWLGAGSNFTSGTLNTSWASTTNANRAVGQTNLAASNGNFWQVTGVQLERGTVATGFDRKPFGVELAECQRYYYRTFSTATAFMGILILTAVSSAQAVSLFRFPTQLRGAPSFSYSSSWQILGPYSYDGTGGITVARINEQTAYFNVAITGATSGESGFLRDNADSNAFFAFDAEL